MLSFNDYKRINKATSLGSARRENASDIMEQTFDEDNAYRFCYIYDYEHDDQRSLASGMTYENTTKTGIDTKYLVTQYGTLSKDQVEYHLLFRNTQDPLPYYTDSFGRNAEFPIGLYIDIPDSRDIFRKWIICSKDMEPDFVKYSILPCNYNFHWVKNGNLYQMWGIARLRNSYNSGVWTDYKITSVENQDQLWLPRNEISNQLFYDDRFIISDIIPEPIAWKVSKVENIHPFGINKIVLAQDKFNANTDYINYETGEMYANYYVAPINANENDFSLQCPGGQEIKVGGSYRTITATLNDENILPELISWQFLIGDEDATLLIDKQQYEHAIKIRFLGDESYLGETLKIQAKYENLRAELPINITAL